MEEKKKYTNPLVEIIILELDVAIDTIVDSDPQGETPVDQTNG